MPSCGLGKLLFGKQKIKLDPDTEVTFSEGGVQIGEDETAYEEIFYRPSDEIRLKAKRARALGKSLGGRRRSAVPESPLDLGPDSV
jgi:hypothetical protein